MRGLEKMAERADRLQQEEAERKARESAMQEIRTKGNPKPPFTKHESKQTRRDLVAEIDYFSGVALAHEEAIKTLASAIIDNGTLSLDAYVVLLEATESAHSEQTAHPEFMTGYRETMENLRAL